MLKRKAVFLLFSLVIFAAAAQAGPAVSFKLFGGAGYWPTGGDFKDLFNSTADRWDKVGYSGAFDLDWKPLAFEGGAQAILALSPRFSLALGAGYLVKTIDQDSVVQYGLGYEFEQINSYKIRAIPVTLDIMYAVSTGPFRLTLSAGLGYYLSAVSFEGHTIDSEAGRPAQPNWLWDIRETYDSENKGVLGFQFGIGTEFRLSERIFLCLDALYRVASFDDIVGVYEWNDVATWTGGSSSGHNFDGKANAWYSESLISGNLWHYLDFSETKPTWNDDSRLFKFDMSGPVIRIGVRIEI